MKNSVIGILSICFGVLGFFSAYWYIGIIPCVVAVILGVVGLTDYLSYKWSSILGLVFAALGVGLFAYVVVTDMDDGKLIVAYDKGDFVYASNVDKGNEALSEFADILADAEVKAAEKALKHMNDDDEQAGTSDDTAADEEWIQDRSVENTVIIDNTSTNEEPVEPEKTVETASGSYAKGKNYGTYWESEWLNMRYDQPSGFTLLSDSQLNDALQLGGGLIDGEFGEGASEFVLQNTVYELMVMSSSGNPNFSLGVEKSDNSIDDYMRALGQQLQAYHGNALLGQSGFEGTQEIGGMYFEKYSFIVDDGGSGMKQTYYITTKEDRMVYIIVTYSQDSPSEADALLSGFSEL